ncbi:MAG TPA: hypothetical protein VHC70_15680 [Phycisphaerales bacterium]|jgi:hypothetical protein|nr:hypothetical protein [Phycisphaerales bacterium]
MNRNTHDLGTHNLLEMASLDAMGLLDPEERDAFERAFHAAAPAVQAQIRREQLRFSRMDELLPKVDPPLGLRARVIAAVRGAMESVAGRKGADLPSLRFPTGVSRFWRVGAIGALAASLVLGYFTFEALNANRGLTDAKQGMLISSQWQQEFGHRFEATFMNPNARLVAFQPASDAPDLRGARASLLLDSVKKSGQLIVKDLPADGEYEVVVVDSNGHESNAIITFKSVGSGLAKEDVAKFNAEAGQQLLIRLRGSNKTILKSSGI